ncbi:hypothetical protein JCM17092_25690 [Haloplanus litoreus]
MEASRDSCRRPERHTRDLPRGVTRALGLRRRPDSRSGGHADHDGDSRTDGILDAGSDHDRDSNPDGILYVDPDTDDG